MLQDPEIEVQNRAVEVLVKARDQQTIKHLLPVLKDENEYARRAAVEVLNEIGDARSVKHLLSAIKDSDWWVRSRAGDALGKIGASAMEGTARQPAAGGDIRTSMIIAAALIEGATLFAEVVCIILATK